MFRPFAPLWLHPCRGDVVDEEGGGCLFGERGGGHREKDEEKEEGLFRRTSDESALGAVAFYQTFLPKARAVRRRSGGFDQLILRT